MGAAKEYSGYGGHEKLSIGNYLSETQTEFRAVFTWDQEPQTVNGFFEMDVESRSHTVTIANQWTASKTPFNPVRVIERHFVGHERKDAGKLNYFERTQIEDELGSSDVKRSITADKVDTFWRSHEVLTSGYLGRTPRKIVTTTRTGESYFYKHERETDGHYTLETSGGVEATKSNVKYKYQTDQDNQTVFEVTTRGDRTKVTKWYELVEDSVRLNSSSNQTMTPPTGSSTTQIEKERFNNKEIRRTDKLTGKVSGYISGSYYSYKSHVLQIPIGGGTPSHTISDSWHTPLGVGSGNPNLVVDDDSYNPNSRLQDGEEDSEGNGSGVSVFSLASAAIEAAIGFITSTITTLVENDGPTLKKINGQTFIVDIPFTGASSNDLDTATNEIRKRFPNFSVPNDAVWHHSEQETGTGPVLGATNVPDKIV
jgi:hypothetical protein